MSHSVTSSSLLSSFSTSSTTSTSISSTSKKADDTEKNVRLYQKLIGIEGLEAQIGSFSPGTYFLTKKLLQDNSSYKEALKETYAETLRVFKKSIGTSAYFTIAARAIFDLKNVASYAPANISDNKSLLAKRIFRNLFNKIKLLYGDGFLGSLFPSEDITSASKVIDYSINPDVLEKMHQWVEDMNLIKMMNHVAKQNNQVSQSLAAQNLLSDGIDPSLEIVHTRAQSFRAWISGNNNILLNITELNLERLGLTSLPPEIEKFINLQTLDLLDNYLTQLPDSIGNLENLRSVTFSYNYITQLPASICKLGNLHTLFIRNNPLKLLPGSFGNLVNLETLDLEKNPLLTQLPNSFGNLVRLRNLALDENSLTQLPDVTNLAENIKQKFQSIRESHLYHLTGLL